MKSIGLTKIRRLIWAAAIFSMMLANTRLASGQTFTTLVQFDGITAASPGTALVQGLDGNFYGTTGIYFGPNVFYKVTATGALTILYTFCSQCGYSPSELMLATDGNFYGTTALGGTTAKGTIFKITPDGDLTTLYTFCTKVGCRDGSTPGAGLVPGSDGNFYGVTAHGGDRHCDCGTVFRITPQGKLTTLYIFYGTSGALPLGKLVQGADGYFYGTTISGGSSNEGTVFKINPAGALKTLYEFCVDGQPCVDGGEPFGALVQGTAGNFFGTTLQGGSKARGTCGLGCGTIFTISPNGVLTTLHRFHRTDGDAPVGGLIPGSDGSLYATTSSGGLLNSNSCTPEGCGTIFKFDQGGPVATLYQFCSGTCPDGNDPVAALLQGTDGNFYGTTAESGVSGYAGTIFSLSVGLGAFVKTLPSQGSLGDSVIILGTNLSGTTAVTFNGIAATFTVVSATEITALVPTGATTGMVQVVTPSGTLMTPTVFRIR